MTSYTDVTMSLIDKASFANLLQNIINLNFGGLGLVLTYLKKYGSLAV